MTHEKDKGYQFKITLEFNLNDLRSDERPSVDVQKKVVDICETLSVQPSEVDFWYPSVACPIRIGFVTFETSKYAAQKLANVLAKELEPQLHGLGASLKVIKVEENK